MTKKERIEFIKNKLAPLFDGMNAEDVLDIVNDNMMLRATVLSQFRLFLKPREAKKT